MTSLKQRLNQGPALLAPGAYDALSALLIEQAGFEAVYLSGASIAYTQLGRPDIGLVSLDHLADVTARLRERVALPLIVDADTGFGNALNVQRTVRMLERCGANALQLEDQTFPKRCGHLSHKGIVAAAEMAGKLRAAVDARHSGETLVIARTDALAIDGLNAALDRAALYVDSGADVVFVEAPRSLGDMRAIVATLGPRVPLLANMVEGGVTPVLSADALSALGFRLVICPGALVRAQVPAMEELLASLKQHGITQAPGHAQATRMLDFPALQRRLGLAALAATGARYDATFDVAPAKE